MLACFLKVVNSYPYPTPKTYDEAMRSDFAVDWKEAVKAEIDNLDKYKVYRWVPKPPGEMPIDSNWAWKVKSSDNGMVAKLKARLVARGFRQIYGVHFNSTMAPVGKLTTFRVLLAEAAQRGMDVTFLDIRSAYLTADLDIPLYMSPPKGSLTAHTWARDAFGERSAWIATRSETFPREVQGGLGEVGLSSLFRRPMSVCQTKWGRPNQSFDFCR